MNEDIRTYQNGGIRFSHATQPKNASWMGFGRSRHFIAAVYLEVINRMILLLCLLFA